MAIQITSRQCKQARSLLKWNIQDLSNKSKIAPRQIERFEKNLARLTQTENASMVKTLESEGIEFLKNMEIKLDKSKGQNQKTAKVEEKSYEVTLEDLLGTSDQPEPDETGKGKGRGFLRKP